MNLVSQTDLVEEGLKSNTYSLPLKSSGNAASFYAVFRISPTIHLVRRQCGADLFKTSAMEYRSEPNRIKMPFTTWMLF